MLSLVFRFVESETYMAKGTHYSLYVGCFVCLFFVVVFFPLGMFFSFLLETKKRRILKTQETLLEVIKGHEVEMAQEDEGKPFAIHLPELPEMPEIRVEIPKEVEDGSNNSGPKLYVRDDGTVDWDGGGGGGSLLPSMISQQQATNRSI